MGKSDRLLVMLMVQLLHQPRQPFDGTVQAMALLLDVLRAHYVAAGAPYGDDAPGFQRWLLDQWPSPKVA